MSKRIFVILMIGMLLTVALAACSVAPPPLPEPTSAPEVQVEPVSVGLVTAIGGIEEKFFTKQAWQGIEKAQNLVPVEASYQESATEADFAQGIDALAQQGANLIITIGEEMSDATHEAAKAHPDIDFAIVNAPSAAPNVRGVLFDVFGVSYMAGYLAGGMSQTGVVCTYGAADIKNASDFMTGFVNGADYYRRQNGVDLEILGWDVNTMNGVLLNEQATEEAGYHVAGDFFDRGCDIIFAVARDAAKGSARAAQQEGKLFIGTTVDWYEAFPEYGNVVLTSVMQNTDEAVFSIITSASAGSFQGGEDYIADLSNNGVDLAPYHLFDARVSQGLKDEVNQVRDNIQFGLLRPAEPWIYDKNNMPATEEGE